MNHFPPESGEPLFFSRDPQPCHHPAHSARTHFAPRRLANIFLQLHQGGIRGDFTASRTLSSFSASFWTGPCRHTLMALLPVSR